MGPERQDYRVPPPLVRDVVSCPKRVGDRFPVVPDLLSKRGSELLVFPIELSVASN